MSEKKTSKNIWLHIMGLLILVELAVAVKACVFGWVIDEILDMAVLIGIALYGFWLYKKPHGNMLKYVIILNALSIVLTSVLSIYEWGDLLVEVIFPILAACMMFYVAGRLNRIEQNRYLFILIAVCVIVGRFSELVSISADPDPASKLLRYLEAPRQLITILTLCCAYFTRYQEHKEAGLADK